MKSLMRLRSNTGLLPAPVLLATPVFLPTLVLAIASIVSGCSGSSEPDLSETQQPALDSPPATENSDDDNVGVDDTANPTDTGELTEIPEPVVPVSDDDSIVDGTEDETGTEGGNGTGNETSSEGEPDSDTPIAVIPDPVIPITTQVTFEITVPAYQSDSLQVRLIWGDTDMTANWIGDEFWSTSIELPTNTEQTLSVTFYDNNGAIELASVSQAYKTGTNAAETVQITATQFDSEQWDTDGDGTSNLAELMAGTDPTVDEDSLLPINDVYSVVHYSRTTVSDDFESLLSEERPIAETTEIFPTTGSSIFLDINIDQEGNGTLTRNHKFGCESINISGTRTHSNNAITWEARRGAHDCDYVHRVNLNNTVTFIDDNTRTFYQEVEGSNVGTYNFSWQATTDLTAQVVEGTSMCEPVYGTYSVSYRHNNDGIHEILTTVSKEIDDPYWKVVRQTSNSIYVANVLVDTNIETTEFFARNIRMGSTRIESEASYFTCDFVDF